MSFCRITGRARNLPKPNFFPLIPPISPADARRLCRITAKRMDDHNFVPLLEIGKRPECLKCNVTGKSSRGTNHQGRDDYKYVTPILKKEVMDKSDLRTFEDLQKVLKRLRSGLDENERDKMYVYLLSGVLCGLIVPAEVEEAVRIGELETVSLSRSCDKAAFKIRGKPTLFIPLKEIFDIKQSNLLDGCGQNMETMAKQKKQLEDKKRKTLANAKIFEELERQADEELSKDLERPAGNRARFIGTGKSREARQFREKLVTFREIFLPEGNMSGYGENWEEAVRPDLSKLDWNKIAKVRSVDLDYPLPKRSKLEPFDETQLNPKFLRRPKNVHVPDGVGLEIIPMTEKVTPTCVEITNDLMELILKSMDRSSPDDYSSRSSLHSMFQGPDKAANLKILPTLEEFEKVSKYLYFAAQNDIEILSMRYGCIYDHGDGLKFCETVAQAPKDANVVVGAVLRIPPAPGMESSPVKVVSRFFPGEMIGTIFVPGQRIASANGEFIPAASVKSGDESFQFLPGLVFNGGHLVMGQFISDLNNNDEVTFVLGQVVQTIQGAKFVNGETVSTPDGIKFVAGLEAGGTFINGVLVDVGGDSYQFVTGQLLGLADEDDQLRFVAGVMENENTFVPGLSSRGFFFPGQMVNTFDLGLSFLYGEVSVTKNNLGHFLPGVYLENDNGLKFHPGVVTDTLMGSKFVEGKLAKLSNEAIFVPGKIVWRDERFEKTSNEESLTCIDPPTVTCQGINESALSVVFKKTKAKTGIMVMTEDGPKFFMESEIPTEYKNAEMVPGRMECFEDGPKFVPGKIMEINGVKTFIPGKILNDSEGREIFVPGKMIHGKNGPKFVPGQVIQAENGEEKFIPGQVIDGIFVPGMIIETKSGPLFIPGQVVRTDDGLKFVPGQIVENEHGALFVPGEVIDSPNQARFVPGQVVDTPEGPRLLPPDIKGDGNLEYLVQGFDINQEEARLILGGCESLVAGDLTDFLGGIGDAAIGGEALTALAEGFDSFNGNMILMMGDENIDVEKILQDESLDSCDSPATRRTLHGVFFSVFKELCQWIDDVFDHFQRYIDSRLNDRLWSALLSADADKLYPALESLKQSCRIKNPHDPPEYEILNLIAGMVFCSLPGALKECASSDGSISESKLRSILSSAIEESVKGILEEDGVISNGRKDDMRELIRLAKDLQFDDNESFFAKVVAVTEGRCGTKFMNDLMSKLREGAEGFSLHQILGRLINVLSPRLHLKTGFTELTACSPDFIEDLLESLRNEADSEDLSQNSIDVLHRAITCAVNRRCQRQLDDVVHRVELDAMLLDKDRDIRAMLEEAIGLSRFMHKDDVTSTLAELLADPIRLEVIRDDPVVRDVLNKILVMRKLSTGDAKKKNKLERLRKYTSDEEDDDTSLREMLRLCDALTRLPHQGQLKKSKSMIKKSKSIIVSARDIPMNAFMAIKSTADRKDENWLQNFLSESLVDDVPWECSKALIILKEGYQAIIPREAARSILLGEASYTVIDDNGVEFYLSPKDKKNRQKQGLDDIPKKRVTLIENDDDLEEAKRKRDKSPVKNGDSNKDEDFPLEESDSYSNVRSYDSAYKSYGTNGKSIDNDYKSYGTSNKSINSDYKSYGSDNKTIDKDYTSKYLDTDSDFGNLDLDASLPKRPIRSRFIDEDLIESSALASLEKYRPCNYEIGPRGEGDDINDIRDYYSGLATRQRAMRRVYDFRNENQNDEDDLYENDTFQDPIVDRRPPPALTSRRALGRTQPQSHHAPQVQPIKLYNDFEDEVSPIRQTGPQYPPQQPYADPYGSGYRDTQYGQRGYGGYYQPQQPQMQPQPMIQPQMDPYGYNNPYGQGANYGYNQRLNMKPELDETTQTLLERARAVRQNSVWDEEISQAKKRSNNGFSKYNWDTDTFEQNGQGQQQQQQSFQQNKQEQRKPKETALSSKTQQLLSKLKESTAALEDMSSQASSSNFNPYLDCGGQSRQPKPTGKKPSRFYHKDRSPVERAKSPGGYNVHDLADDILGENIRPPREPSRRLTHPRPGDDDISTTRGRYSGSLMSTTSSLGRKYSEPASYTSRVKRSPDRYQDSGSRYSPVRSSAAKTSRKVDPDDDLDAMISDLKRRTATRDMYKVLSEMEGREITPVRRTDFSPSPQPEPRTGRRPEPRGQRVRYDRDEDDRADSFSPRYGSSRSNDQRPEPRAKASSRYYDS